MGRVMSQAVVDDSSIEEIEFSSIFLTEDELTAANDIKLVDGRWVYEVNRIIPLTSEEWEHLALEILMKESIEQEAPEAPVENNTTADEQEAIQEHAPEVEQVEAIQEEISVEVEAEQTVVLEEPEVVQEAETPTEVKQAASAKALPEYSFIHGFKDLFFPAY